MLYCLIKQNQKLNRRNLELEEELCRVKQQLQDTSQKFLDRTQELNKENQSITQGNLELEQKLAMVKQQLQDFKTSHAQEDLEDNFDMSHRENDSEDTRDDAAREVDEKLKDLNQQLHRKVTSLLQVPEVKEDKLRVPVTLDLLKRLSVSLQELYSSVLSMAAETFKCSEKVKREFYDFAYHGIRAEHNDLVHRVEDLATAQEEMTDEEKKDFGKLQKLQTNRQREVDKLENLWKGLFSPALQPESLPPSSYSAPCGATCYSEKDSRRKCTDPIAQPKSRVRLGEQNTSPVAKTMRKDKKFGRRFTNMKKTFFGKKRSEENLCRLMSYSAMNHRDS
ncbi:uncharacterized protein LOC111331007 [Stylophora pistillata]|uniref:uncharacterized protein LOC111331007 n=1 Tax=Stylophora pistillata TaxID=50429 RepID=UPI000C04ACEA|nr:uncharacterized protein LOC111331007 [Stylophora pistillata]